ncbi:SMP-30/gluconolactonase/LRE family protein [Spirosoma sp. BT702]|uniref:SMP-30/gluconolactonase/LRE family protein n=1 Tax=Spirosoma profusum TaxID=2771354 RepID=A0A926XWG5_9BACT|nr:SMP-30/gluconolactonase/LRE family protein [Spirosoma profusum]MBD2701799.1 SMP-30/gluconolactonase/LRE family protein [Spirosoma profusum]
MKTKLLLISGWLTTALSPAFAQTSPLPTIGQVVRADPRLDKLILPDTKIEVLADGFMWTEGPVWVKSEAFLLFSDIPQNTIYKWTDKEGVTTFLKPSGYTGVGTYGDEPGSNGLAIDKQGRLISCEHGDRRITAMPVNGGGGKRTLADNFNGKRFNSPNDVAVHSNGSYYFTDPPYGMPKKEKDPGRETDGYGVYRIAPERNGVAGAVSIVVSDLSRPNGIALSPDEKTLFVAQSDPLRPVVMAYPIQADGSVGKGRIVFGPENMKKQGLEGGFDGMKVDRDGNLWVTGSGGVLVLAPTQGTGPYDFLGHIKIGAATANCAWGDDGTVLYITADMYLCRIRTTAKGW